MQLSLGEVERVRVADIYPFLCEHRSSNASQEEQRVPFVVGLNENSSLWSRS